MTGCRYYYYCRIRGKKGAIERQGNDRLVISDKALTDDPDPRPAPENYLICRVSIVDVNRQMNEGENDDTLTDSKNSGDGRLDREAGLFMAHQTNSEIHETTA